MKKYFVYNSEYGTLAEFNTEDGALHYCQTEIKNEVAPDELIIISGKELRYVPPAVAHHFEAVKK